MRRWKQPAVAATRQVLPVPVRRAVSDRRAQAAFRRPEVRDSAVAQMRFLLEHSDPDADLEAIAGRHVEQTRWRGERSHSVRLLHFPVDGVDPVAAMLSQGRGALLNFMHHGAYDGMTLSLQRLGLDRPVHVILAPELMHGELSFHQARRLRRMRDVGAVGVSREVGFAGIAELVSQGNLVMIASDVPGSTPVTLAGRSILSASGAARLAFASGAPVVPVTTTRAPTGERLQMATPIEPEEHGTPEELLRALYAVHERAILRWPEAMDDPMRRWGLPVDAPRPG